MTKHAKVMLLGDIGVGKSSIARRLVFDRFESEYKSTIGVDILSYELDVGPEPEPVRMKLMLWDTDGEFGVGIFNAVYIKGASAALIVADASRPATLEKMQRLSDHFQEMFPGRPFRMVINKIDLIDDTARQQFSSHFADRNCVFTSALNGYGVADAIQSLSADIVRFAP